MTDLRKQKENVKIHLNELRKDLKIMHINVIEELLLPHPDEIKALMIKMDELLKVIESK